MDGPVSTIAFDSHDQRVLLGTKNAVNVVAPSLRLARFAGVCARTHCLAVGAGTVRRSGCSVFVFAVVGRLGRCNKHVLVEYVLEFVGKESVRGHWSVLGERGRALRLAAGSTPRSRDTTPHTAPARRI